MPNDPRTDRGWAAALVNGYVRLIVAIATASMSIVVVVMTVQVFFRYGLNSSLIWAEEICRYFLILMTFVLIGIAYQRGEMVSVQFFMRRLPTRVAHFVQIPVHLAIIAFLLVVSWFGYQFATFNGRFAMPAIDFILTSLMGRQVSGAMTMYWVYLLIPLGCVLLSIHFAATLVRTARAAFGREDD